MKKITSILVIALILISCGAKVKGNDGQPGKDGMSATAAIAEKVTITQSSIQKSMEFLASDDLNGRATGSEGIEKAAVFIETYLKESGIKPYFDTYRDDFEFVNERAAKPGETPTPIKGFNIVGVIEGNDPELKNEYIILGRTLRSYRTRKRSQW